MIPAKSTFMIFMFAVFMAPIITFPPIGIRITPIIRAAVSVIEIEYRRRHDHRGGRVNRRRLDVGFRRGFNVNRRWRSHDNRRRRRQGDIDSEMHAGLGDRNGPE